MPESPPGPLGELDMYRFLLALDDALRPLVATQSITQTAATMLGTFLKVSRCVYAHGDPQLETFTLVGDYTDGVPSFIGRYRAKTSAPNSSA